MLAIVASLLFAWNWLRAARWRNTTGHGVQTFPARKRGLRPSKYNGFLIVFGNGLKIWRANSFHSVTIATYVAPFNSLLFGAAQGQACFVRQ